MINGLSLAEQILLLNLDERSGQIQGSYTPLLLTAAEIAELAILGRVEVTDKAVCLVNDQPTDDPGWNALLSRLKTARRGLSLSHIRSLGGDVKRLQKAASGRLVARGIWAVDVVPFFFFPRTVYAAIDPSMAAQIKQAVQTTLESRQPVSQSRATLIGLLKAGQKLDLVLTRHEQRFFKERIQYIIDDSWIASGLCAQVERVIAQDNAAAASAVMVVTSG